MTEQAGLSPAAASEPAETALPAEGGHAATPGGMLAARRAARGLAVTDVAQRLKFGVRQIEALEANDFAQLPAGTFVRGMIRGYARMLEMDPAPVLAGLDRIHVPTPDAIEPRAAAIPFPGTVKRSNRVFVLLSAVIVLAAAFLLYEWQFASEPAGSPEPRVEAAAASPAVAAAPAAASAADTAAVAKATTGTSAAAAGAPAMASASAPAVAPASASAAAAKAAPAAAAKAPTAPTPTPPAKSPALPAYAPQPPAPAAPSAGGPQPAPATAPKPPPAAAGALQAPAASSGSVDKNARLAAAPLPGAMPVSAVSSPAAGASGKAGQLSLHFDQDAWVQIRQADGKLLMAQLNHGGTEQLVEGTPPFTVIIGNAPSVRLTYNNAPVDLRPYFKVDVARLTLD